MTALIEQFHQNATNEAEGAWAAYREIIARSSNPKEGDAALLASLFPCIGLTIDDVQEHIAAMAEAKQHEATIAGHAGHAAHVAKGAKLDDELAEAQEALRAAQERAKAITNDCTAHANAGSRFGTAQMKLNELRSMYWRIFDEPEPVAEVEQPQQPHRMGAGWDTTPEEIEQRHADYRDQAAEMEEESRQEFKSRTITHEPAMALAGDQSVED